MSDESKTPTPETDAAEKHVRTLCAAWVDGTKDDVHAVPSQLARNLERRLGVACAELENLRLFYSRARWEDHGVEDALAKIAAILAELKS